MQPPPLPALRESAAPGTGRRLQIAIGVLTVALLAAYGTTHALKVRDDAALTKSTAVVASQPPPVETVTVHPAGAGQALTLPGETAAWFESMIYARVSGYVGHWTADIGDHVTKGQVLATIETPELDAALTAAKAQRTVSQAQIKVWEARADFAKSTYARWRDSPKGVVSEQEREEKRQGYDSAVAELASARAKADLDQAEVKKLEAFQAFKQVTAPYSGTIVERHIDIGNLVTAGSAASTTPLYRLAKDDPIRVFVDVPQAAAADLMKVGVPARIMVAGRPDHPIEGKITRTSGAVDPHARTFRVEVDIANPNNRLVSGLYVRVGFDLANSGLLEVPAAALTFRSRGPEVAVVNEEGRVTFRPVTIARDDGNMVVLASGVTEDEKVVLNISNQITDGSSVRVRDTGHQSASLVAPIP